MGENDGVPFDVIDEVTVEGLDEVKEQNIVLPPTQNLLVRIESISADKKLVYSDQDEGPDNPVETRTINVHVKVVDGVLNTETSEMEYVNKSLFARMWTYANLDYKTSDWWKNRQHLVDLKYLLMALGEDLKSWTLSDSWIAGVLGRELRVNVLSKPRQEKAVREDGSPVIDEKGKVVYKNVPGEFRNELKAWKAA
jgi:hypothetical protein